MKTNHALEAYGKVELNEGLDDSIEKSVKLDKIAKAKGLTDFGETFYSWGTKLEKSGSEAFKQKVQLMEAKPFVTELEPKFEAIIKKEGRMDFEVKTSTMSYNGAKEINIHGKFAGLPINRWALGQLLTRVKAPAGALNVLDPSSDDVQQLPLVVGAQMFSSYMNGKDKAVKIRVRECPTAEVFAVLSPKYPNFDGDKAVKAFAAKADPAAKGDFQYDGRRWKFSASMGTTVEPVVGEIFEAYVWISGCDDGSSAIEIGVDVVRVRCVNLTTLVSSQTRSIRHSGKQDTLEGRIDAGLERAFETIKEFGEYWKNAQTHTICDNMQLHGADKTFLALAKKRLVYQDGVSVEDMAARLYTAWVQEPGYTKASVLNAITRAAHSNSWDNPWAVQDLAKQAGEMLYSKVFLTERDFSLVETTE